MLDDTATAPERRLFDPSPRANKNSAILVTNVPLEFLPGEAVRRRLVPGGRICFAPC
jgi:hypothetical protein